MSHKEVLDLLIKILLVVVPLVLGWFVAALIRYRAEHAKKHEELASLSTQKNADIYDRIREVVQDSEEKYMSKEAYALIQERVEEKLDRIEARDLRASEFLEKILEKYTDGHLDHEKRLSVVEKVIE